MNILPLGLHTAFFGIIFFGIGYLTKKHVNLFADHRGSIRLFAFIIIVIILQVASTFLYSSSIDKTTIFYKTTNNLIEKLSKQMKTNSLNKILYFYQKIFTNEFFKFSAGELKAHLKDRLDEAKISLKDKFILYNAPI